LLEDRLSPATLTVNSTADTAQPTDPYLSLREAVAIANSPTLPSNLSPQILHQINGNLHTGGSDLIAFDHTAVTSPITLSSPGLHLSLPGSTATITIDGGSGGITVDANYHTQILQVDAAVQASLVHLTLTRGASAATGGGGGILTAGTLTVDSCTLTSNFAGTFANRSGGGISNSGTLTVSNSTFQSNSATGGGGIANSGTLVVTGSTFTSNSASYGNGGAISNSQMLQVSNCTLNTNSAYGGGGIFNSGTGTVSGCTLGSNSSTLGGGLENSGTLSLTNSTFNSNTASFGGGLDWNGTGTVTGCSFLANSAAQEGGGLRNLTTLDLTNCTLSGNLARNSGGGGIANQSTLTVTACTLVNNSAALGGGISADPSATLHLLDSIVAGNAANPTQPLDINSTVVATSSYNLVGIGDSGLRGISDGVNHNQIGTLASPLDPRLGPLANNGGPTLTRALLLGSPAIGTGDPALAGQLDQRGVTRHITPSIGAYEGPRLWAVTTLADSGAGSLRDNLTHAGNGELVAFAHGVYGVITLTSGELQLPNGVTLFGPGANVLSVSGNNASRVFEVAAGSTARLEGLTVTAGNASQGGGIANHGTLTLNAVSVQGCSASGSGAGIFNDGTLTLTASTVSGNVSQGTGGGVANTGALQLSNVTLSGNQGTRGAAIAQGGGTLSVTGTTVSGNTASVANAGIDLGGSATLRNSLVAGNTLAAGGASDLGGGTVDASSSYNLIGTGGSGGLVDGVNHNRVGVADAHLGSLADNGGPTRTIALLSDSPAISAGDPSLGGTLDQRGRPRHHTPSIGAFEPRLTFVVSTLADSGDGSLRAELGQVAAGDTVTFADGVSGTITLTTGELALSTNVTISGPGADHLSVSGNQHSRIFHVLPGVAVSLSELTITRGSSINGGGINNEGTLFLSDSVLSSNTAHDFGTLGGGIYNSGRLTVTHSTFRNNQVTTFNGAATRGGAIYNANVLTVADCTLESNSTGQAGGGICNDTTGTTTVSDCTLRGNSAFYGGGIYNIGTMTVSGSRLTGNTGTRGGAIISALGPLTVVNSTISGNFAIPFSSGNLHPWGGGIEIPNTGTVTVVGSTITGNSSAVLGGGIHNYLGHGTLVLQSTLLSGNISSNEGGPDVYGSVDPGSSYTLIGAGDSTLTGISDGVNHNQVGTTTNPIDPLLTPLGYYGGPTQTIALQPGSPARGAGDPGTTLTTDQRGLPRVVGGLTDIGAFQSQANPLVVTTLLDPGHQSGQMTLREAVSLASVLSGSNTVTFADSLASGTVTLTAGELLLTHDLSIAGPAAGPVTVSGNNASRVFEVAAGVSASLSSLIVANGRVSSTSVARGGGLLDAGNLTLTDCMVTNNQVAVSLTGTGTEDVSAQGGGIYTSGPLTLLRCTVAGNAATLSAGNLDFGSANGGGLYANGAVVGLTNSTVAGNSASATFTGGTGLVFGYGGGLTSDNGTLTLTGCTVNGNTATGGNAVGYGGGLHAFQSTVSLSNCTIANNSAGSGADVGLGGGVSDLDSNLTLTSCTVTGNSASSAASTGSGGALYYNSGAGSAQLLNTIVAGNSSGSDGPDVSGTFTSLGYNLIGITDGSSGWGGSDLTGTRSSPLNPLLGALGNYGGPTQTVPLLAGSPALDAGDPAQLGSADQRGVVRSGGVNIGAFQASLASFVVSAPNTATAGVPFDVSVTVYDSFGQLVVGYLGTIHFSSTDNDPNVVLPADYTFGASNGGSVTFSGGVTLFTPGSQTVTATDLGSGISGNTIVTL
jgi:hypothetical protein